MPQQYAFMIETAELKAGAADATSDEISQSLGLGLGNIGEKITKALPTLPPGGWQVVSHDITRIDRHLVVTILIRRQL